MMHGWMDGWMDTHTPLAFMWHISKGSERFASQQCSKPSINVRPFCFASLWSAAWPLSYSNELPKPICVALTHVGLFLGLCTALCQVNAVFLGVE